MYTNLDIEGYESVKGFYLLLYSIALKTKIAVTALSLLDMNISCFMLDIPK